MRILVTGLTGFTGQHIKDQLESDGHDVIGLVSDITDREAVFAEVKKVNPEAVMHLAGLAFVGHGGINDFYQVNLLGTSNLLEALHQGAPNIKSVLLASSANVYGNQENNQLDETSNLNPVNHYAVSKYSMEKMASLWFDQLPIVIVRPFNYTGVRQNKLFLIPKIVSHFHERADVIELGNLEVYREFNDVRMVAEIYKKLIYAAPTATTVNVCTGKVYALKDIIKTCEDITGHSLKVKVNPQFVRKNEVKSLAGCNKKLKELVSDWHTPSIEDTLQWMLSAS